MNEQAAVVLASTWESGVCHFCGVTEEHVDGDRVCWLNLARSVCNQPGCITRFSEAVARWARRPRRLTSAEVSERIRRRSRKGRVV